MIIKIRLIYFLLLICSSSFGQIKQYTYKRELQGIEDQWHKIALPVDIFQKILPDLADMRIFGIKKNNDTIEAPYILQFAADKNLKKDVAFNIINQSKNDKGYYFTFEIPAQTPVNEIKLEFSKENFDWRLGLEGSEDQQQWFSIISDYRILAIKNELTDFRFTTIAFPISRYRYFRLLIESEKETGLTSAKISLTDTIKGSPRNYIHSLKTLEEKDNRQTIINADLQLPGPISKLKIYVKDSFDFYRPVTIQYLSDSFKTQQGWRYNYITLASGTLNSIDKREFEFNNTILQKLKIIIENHDNEPLQIDSVGVGGNVSNLIVRFNEPGTYYLVYGNKQAAKPYYDVERFVDKIPAVLKELKPGEEQLTGKETAQKGEPLFLNKIWLWIIMGFIIVLLGWFSLRMIRRK